MFKPKTTTIQAFWHIDRAPLTYMFKTMPGVIRLKTVALESGASAHQGFYDFEGIRNRNQLYFRPMKFSIRLHTIKSGWSFIFNGPSCI